MSNESIQKKNSSITRRLYGMLQWKLFFAFFFTDLLAEVCVIGGYLYYQIISLLDSPRLLHSVTLEGTLKSTLFLVLTDQSGTAYAVDATLPARLLRDGTLGLLAIQGVCLLFSLCFDYFRVKGRLRPLAQLAANAEELSRMSFDEARFQQLESAISQVSPEAPDAHVQTNDPELQGIETALNSLLSQMREAYRQQGRFVSDASHELRTPIAVIKGYIDILDRWGKEDPQVLSESITAIKNETNHMNRLVEQLLFLARSDSGRNPLHTERFSLSQMAEEVYEESRMIDEAHVYELLREPADILACGDPTMLKQALRILIDNAAKYTNPGDTITLRVGMSRNYQPCLSVQDNGSGIQSQDVSHIFERFYRSDQARNSETGGTGLGLSIAKWIIDRHRGTIEVVSRPEIGTRFTIRLQSSL